MRKERMLYLDNVRAALMVLVVLQHAVRAYGSTVWWFVRDAQAPLLERFTAVNSSFFMSAFFLLSFYFMPASYDRKGFLEFHRDRFRRLFVPLAAYVACVSPVMMYAYYRLARAGTLAFPAYFRDVFLGLGGKPAGWSGPSWPDANFGHLWFVEHLILYGIAYSLVRLAWKRREAGIPGEARPARAGFPPTLAIAGLAAAMAAASFAIRVEYPLYRWIGVAGCIQAEPAHFPFYLAMFCLGIAAYRRGWLTAIPDRAGKAWSAIGIASAAAVSLFPVSPDSFGGGTPLSLAYACCESPCCVGLIVGILYWAKRLWNRQTRLVKALADNSYMMYIVHLPVVVAIQFALRGTPIHPYAKFAIVAAFALPVTLLASAGLRRIPWVGRNI